jgi:carbon storage regulator CsrA
MLVITRQDGESFVIEPAGVRITIIGKQRNGRVRVGIDAPQSQTILREELVGNYERLKREAEASLSRRKQNEQASER